MPAFKRLLRNELFLSILLVIILSALAYLPFISQLGYYHDDWHAQWAWANYGPLKIFDMAKTDRTFAGLVTAATFVFLNWFGKTPIVWHGYIFLIRLAGSLGVFWLARMLLPGQPRKTTLIALLFAVYPGFLELPTAVSYQSHLISLASGIFSICLSLWAFAQPRSVKVRSVAILAAMLLALAAYLNQEWLIGLEGVRAVLLGYLFLNQQKQDWRQLALRVLKAWLPNLLALAAFLIWRIVFFKTARAATDVGALAQLYTAAPLEMLMRLLVETLQGFINTILLSWAVPFYDLISHAQWNDILLSLLPVLVGIVCLVSYDRFLDKQNEKTSELAEGGFNFSALVWTGAVCVLVTILPPIFSNRILRFEDTFDRYTLAGMLGTALLVTGLIFGLLRHEHRVWMAGLLIAVSLMTQFYNNASYRDFWNSQKQFWWQLTWRAPDIKDQTVLYALLPSSAQLAESYEVWGPANLIYRNPQQPLGIMGEILNMDTVLPLQQQAQYGRTFRRIQLNYDTQNSLIMSLINPQTCLHVLDGQNLELSEKEDALIRLAAADSHIDRIVTSGPSKLPPANIFGSEPPHTWCYYYEKASLARQAENWQEVARLGDEAKQLGFSPLDVSEWMPFYVGYAHVSRLDEVNGIGSILRGSPGFIDPYCFQKKQQPLPADRIDQFLVQNLCPEIK